MLRVLANGLRHTRRQVLLRAERQRSIDVREGLTEPTTRWGLYVLVPLVCVAGLMSCKKNKEANCKTQLRVLIEGPNTGQELNFNVCRQSFIGQQSAGYHVQTIEVLLDNQGTSQVDVNMTITDTSAAVVATAIGTAFAGGGFQFVEFTPVDGSGQALSVPYNQKFIVTLGVASNILWGLDTSSVTVAGFEPEINGVVPVDSDFCIKVVSKESLCN